MNPQHLTVHENRATPVRYFWIAVLTIDLCGCDGPPGPLVPEAEASQATLADVTLADARMASYSGVAESIRNQTEFASGGATQPAVVFTTFDATQFQRPMPPVVDDPSVEVNVSYPWGILSLDSREHAVEEPHRHRLQHQPSPLILVTPPPDATYDYPYAHDFDEWTLFKYRPQDTEMAYVSVSWDNYNIIDSLSGGYWVHAHGDLANYPSYTANVGAFVDGREFDAWIERPAAVTLPATGSVTYIGHSAGLYTYYYGAASALFDRADLIGGQEIGVWSGNALVHVDFDRGRISACIGCLVQGFPEAAVVWESDGHVELVNGQRTAISATYHNRDFVHFSRIRLQETALAVPGTAMTGDLTLENDYDFFVGGDGGTSQGEWNGQFSHIPNPDGFPRIIGGTVRGTWTGSDGRNGETGGVTHTEFVGFFFVAPKSRARFNFPLPAGGR